MPDVIDDDYVYPGSAVLKNKYDIRDDTTLSKLEYGLTHNRYIELCEKNIRGRFDLGHLQAIHAHLFQDLYDWAGKLRTVNISKDTSIFALHGFIEKSATALFSGMAAEGIPRPMSTDTFAERAAYYFSELNAIHPFREGNGRAQRVFFDQLAKECGQILKWEKVSTQEFMAASIAGFNGSNSAMKTVFLKIAQPHKARTHRLQSRAGEKEKGL